jgi:subtilisin family serine protease
VTLKDLRELKQAGIRPIRYLSQLQLLIGEAQKPFVHPDIEYAEPDIRIQITKPYMESTKALYYSLPWGVERIEAPRAWPITKGKGVRVAVIDTGINYKHPAIQKNYYGGVNILSSDNEPYDYNGHGTHVAGIIAGFSSELGVIGVAPKVKLYAVKAFNRRGSANLSDLLSAINWCIEKKMNVINMSFGMDQLSESLRYAIQMAHKKGIVMVAATGNQGMKGKIDFPARYPETIAVISTNKNDQISSFSNIGEGIDIAAPGEKILSAWLNNSTREMSGTSMAVPHVTGTVALLLFLQPRLNPEQIRWILKRSSQKLDSLPNIGLVNAYQAVKTLEKQYQS